MHESRLINISGGLVRFAYRDPTNSNRQWVMSTSHEAFIGRNLSHVQPRGFVRIRHYGLLANACRAKKLTMIRSQCGAAIKLSEALNERKLMN